MHKCRCTVLCILYRSCDPGHYGSIYEDSNTICSLCKSALGHMYICLMGMHMYSACNVHYVCVWCVLSLVYIYSILRGRIKGTACSVFVIQNT